MHIAMELLHANSADVYLWLEADPQVPSMPDALFPPVSPVSVNGKRKVVFACPVTGTGLFISRGGVCVLLPLHSLLTV